MLNCLLVRWLDEHGHTAFHVQDFDLAGAEDRMISDYALQIGAIILTKDDDFAERTSRTASGPIIVWLRIGNSTNRVLFAWLEPRWGAIIQLLSEGNRLIEVR